MAAHDCDVCAGHHECDLCRFEGESRGSTNFFIPYEGAIYVCPELIVHYINAHGYSPPELFCRAVLACPPMRSMPYLRAIAACGGAHAIVAAFERLDERFDGAGSDDGEPRACAIDLTWSAASESPDEFGDFGCPRPKRHLK